MRPIWFVKLLKKTFPNVIFIAKLTKFPLVGKLIEILMFQDDYLIFLPRDRVININKEIEGPTDYVIPSQIVNYFIEKSNYHWIMNFCICRDSMKCKNYPTNFGCLFLGEAVLQINPLLGRRVDKIEALEYVKKCREIGLVHIIGRNKLDSQWLNVKPGSKLLTICNCCSCCCLYRIIPYLKTRISDKIQKMPGVKVRVTNKCVGCGTCAKNVCFVNAIYLVNNRAFISKRCRGCGRCVDVCPQKAIELRIDNKEYFEKAIKNIEKMVDVV